MMKAIIAPDSGAVDPLAPCAAGLRLHAKRRYEDAIVCFRQALALDPELAEAHNHLGRSLNNLRRLDEAALAFREALRLRPDYAEAHNHLGHVLRAQGELEDAAAAFGESLRLEPDRARAHHNLGTVRNAQGRFAEAAESFRRGLAIDSQDAMGWTNFGNLLCTLERHDEAIAAYRDAIAADGKYIDAYVNLGALLRNCARLPEAMNAYRAALAIDPEHCRALAGIAGVMEVHGRWTEALALIGPYVTKRPAHEELVVAHARLLRRLGRRAEAHEDLQRLLAAGEAKLEHAAGAHFALGDLYDDFGEHARAFEHYDAANQATRSRFDPERFADGVESLVDFFTSEMLARLPRSGNASECPVFIVGMPRSGTSLVEQILAAHSSVHACGERNELFALSREMSGRLGSSAPYPYALRKIAAARLEEFAEEYLATAGTLEEGILRITDKLPANFLNFGLIELLFPNARIIHCRRHPLDTAVSCYFQQFASQAFASRLEHIGIYMNLYRRVMAHWRRVGSLPMLDVDYEDLVAKPEAASRRMIAFLGLAWEPACLRFHELDRLVATASYAQVREPIYGRSVGRYRSYEPWLKPLLDVLDEGTA